MFRGNPRLLIIAAALLLLAACETKRPPFEIDAAKYGDAMNREAASPGVLIRKRAAQVYELNYFVTPNHKAMAQSSSGNWSWSRHERSVDIAIDEALRLCRDRNESYEASQPCLLINVDGFWIAEFSNQQ